MLSRLMLSEPGQNLSLQLPTHHPFDTKHAGWKISADNI